jgi:hypothetical protein
MQVATPAPAAPSATQAVTLRLNLDFSAWDKEQEAEFLQDVCRALEAPPASILVRSPTHQTPFVHMPHTVRRNSSRLSRGLHTRCTSIHRPSWQASSASSQQ